MTTQPPTDAAREIQEDREADCKHKFSGWREHDDGLGGETVCEHCGIGAMAYTFSLDI